MITTTIIANETTGCISSMLLLQYKMSETIIIKQEPLDIIIPTNGCTANATNDIVDLTLSDTDDEIKSNEDNTHSPTSVTQSQEQGSYTKFSIYATSLRKRVDSKKRSFQNDDEEDDDDTTPFAVTPRKKKTTLSSKGPGDSSVSSSDDVNVGAVGYAFHKEFYVDGKKKTLKMFHGEVIDIVGSAVASKYTARVFS